MLKVFDWVPDELVKLIGLVCEPLVISLPVKVPLQEPEIIVAVSLFETVQLVAVPVITQVRVVVKGVVPDVGLAERLTVGAGAVIMTEQVLVIGVEVPELIVTEAFLVPVPTVV